MPKAPQQAADEVVWDSARPSFVQLPEWLLFHPEVSDGATRTWMALASYADRGGEAFPGVNTLAERRNLTRRAIFRHLDELESAGALRRNARYRDTDGGRTSTLYVLAWAHPMRHPALQDDAGHAAPLTANSDRPTAARSRRSRPGTPVPKLSPPHDKIGTGPGDKIVTPRTIPTKEVTPIVPTSSSNVLSQVPNPKGAVPPSDSPPRGSDKHSSGRRRMNPRATGTNPRAVARQATALECETDRLENARSYGTNMAAVQPPQWTTVEFETFITEAHSDDPDWIQAALSAYIQRFDATTTPPGDTNACRKPSTSVGSTAGDS